MGATGADDGDHSDRIERVTALDVLRGVAVMGILVMNINNWGLGRPAYWNPRRSAGLRAQYLMVWWIDTLFAADNDARLFSLMLAPHPFGDPACDGQG